LIVSGILSERVISAIEVAWIPGTAIAGERTHDRVRVRNRRRSTLFSIEVGEWKGNKRTPILYVPRLGPLEEITQRSEQVLPQRGLQNRDGFFVATSYPFGFARKLLLWRNPGSRLVWPGPRDSQRRTPTNHPASLARIERGVPQTVEGELRAYVEGDPLSDVVWTASARGQGWWVRPRKSEHSTIEVVVNLRGHDLEEQIRQAAQPFLHEQPATLRILDSSSTTACVQVRDRVEALDRLAKL
jgi:uncharacterized protein (DUF58 family)